MRPHDYWKQCAIHYGLDFDALRLFEPVTIRPGVIQVAAKYTREGLPDLRTIVILDEVEIRQCRFDLVDYLFEKFIKDIGEELDAPTR